MGIALFIHQKKILNAIQDHLLVTLPKLSLKFPLFPVMLTKTSSFHMVLGGMMSQVINNFSPKFYLDLSTITSTISLIIFLIWLQYSMIPSLHILCTQFMYEKPTIYTCKMLQKGKLNPNELTNQVRPQSGSQEMHRQLIFHFSCLEMSIPSVCSFSKRISGGGKPREAGSI